MIGIGRPYTLGMSLGQLLASKTHSNVNSRKKKPEKLAIPVNSIFFHGKKFTFPYIAPEHAPKHSWNRLSG